MMRFTDEAMTYGSIPRSTRRVIVAAESFVWSVESTRWPVCAAWNATRAVSLSRISPTRMTSGSWRSTERSTLANVSPCFSLISTWLMPFNWYSTGFSIVMMLVVVERIARMSA